MPKIPVIKEVIIFKPIWKFIKLPIVLIVNIRIPPKTEFPIILAIVFKGIIKNFPNKNKKMIQPIYTTIVFISKTITFFLIT